MEYKPIYCKNCELLAMAKLEGTPLCTGCLMSALLATKDPAMLSKVLPLEIGPGVRKVSPPKRLAVAS